MGKQVLDLDYRWRARVHWRTIFLIWVLSALVTAPAAQWAGFSQTNTLDPLLLVFVQVFIHQGPWVLALPAFVKLSRRFPLGLGHTPRNLVALFLVGALVTPLLTAVGVVPASLVGMVAVGGAASFDWGRQGLAIYITSLFALPTYVALVGIGQTIAFFERYQQRERLLARTREAALRAQIAPHFLFNTLNAVSALGYLDPARADRALVQLGALLRETLDGPPYVSFADEVAMVADYVELHRLLLDDRLGFELNVAPDAWGARIPAMLLQPLIENAIVHGIARLPGGGVISLRVEGDGRMLRLALVNDAPVTEAKSGLGIGLRNVRERLAATYGDAARLEFRQEGASATAIILLPLESATA